MSRLLARLAPLYDGLVIFGVLTFDLGWLGLGAALLYYTAAERAELAAARAERQLMAAPAQESRSPASACA